jgi:hypothetical protein
MMRLPYPTFIEIEWEDAASNDGWISKEEDTSPVIIVSRGWLVRETDTYITIANSIHKFSDQQVGGTQTVPLGMIKSRRELKVTNARSKLRHKLHPEPSAEEIHREPGEGGPVLK